MARYQAKDSGVLQRQLKVQTLVIPFTCSASATPSAKVVTNDEPSILFLNFQGNTGITQANGALEAGETLPSLATATDSTGVINILALIHEPLVKVMRVTFAPRNGATGATGTVLAFTTGSTNSGQSVVANITTGVNLTTTAIDACIVVEYITQE